MFKENWEKASKRNSAAISAWLGANGSGKTAGLVHDAVAAMLEGRPQLSTVPLLDWREVCVTCDSSPCVPDCGHLSDAGPKRPPHPLWVPFTSLEQLLDWRDGDVNMDEVQGVASAVEHQGLPYQVANWLRKMRHANARLRWSAPDWMAANAVIRRVTRSVTVAEGRLGTPHVEPCPVCGEQHIKPTKACDLFGRSRLWDDNRVLSWKTFDATKFEEFNANRVNESASKKHRLKPMVRQTYWRSKGFIQDAYDTYGEVISLGVSDTAGVCISCGGTRRRKPCSCADQQDATATVNLRDAVRSGVLAAAGSARGPARGVRGTRPVSTTTDAYEAP